MLKVVVESAKGIPKKTLGIPDPIAAVIFKGEKKKTKAIDKELNPVWNEIIEFDLKGTPLDSSSFIDVIVKDYETVGKDKFIGSAKIFLKELAAGQTRSLPSKNIPLINEKKQEFGATISLMIGYEPPASTVPNPNDQNMGDAQAGETAAGEEEKGVDSDEDAGDVVEPGAPGVSPSGQPKKMVRTTRKRQKTLANKPQDFQIRVRIIEGRQLPGNNVKPVVKVNVCGQTHRTRIRRGNNPFFDEIFFYNVNMLPSELFDESISIRVYNAYSLRADSLMGEFKLDVGYVYDEPGHAIMRKWLLLSDPDDSISGTRGYLKVSMFIVGTGDEPPVEKQEASEEQDDIESNLLLPAGVSLRWATLSLKIYRAEDMPQMDDAFAQTVKSLFSGTNDKKNLVDPFLEVSFAGKKVCTKIIEKNANPEWNQLIHLQVKGEGVAYRGRVLIELSTQLDDKTDKKVEDISNDDNLVAQKYQRRRKYSLCAVFHSSCMLQEPGEPIQFEVSIGNYGNKLDSTCKPLASTTQYSCAVFDGNHYYYLPWADSKPVVILTSFWEDISHRLDAVNIILYISDRLQANIVSLKTALLAKVSDSRLAEIWLKLITQLIDDLSSYQLPDLEGKPNLTALDIQIKNLRDKTMASVKEAAIRMREEAVDVRATMPDIEDWLERLQQITEEPQNSMPDVIIWMLRGEKRVAYARIPANQVLYSTHSEQAIGKYCGRTQSIFMQYPMDKNKGLKIPVQLRVNMWLGLSAHEKNFNSFAEGTFSVYAEMVRWEYGVTIPPDDKPRSWGAAEKMYHIHRRKRLVRPRRKISDTPTTEKKDIGDGWEYSSLIGWKFHRKERSSDTFRRRRWRRKMAPAERVGPSAIFNLEGALGIDDDEKGSKKDPAKLFGANTPTVFCRFDKSFIYHLRVYAYQAKNLLPMDKDSFSDPYVYVSFLHVSKTTEIVKSSLNPTWDQTLIFDDIEIYGDPQTIAHNPPSVVLEVYDNDQVGKDEPMGRCTCPPVVKLNPATPLTPKLLWFPITMKGRNAGEMLVAAELLLKDKANDVNLPLVPPRRSENLYMVPQGIRPVVQLTAIEILAWGLRNMKAYQLATVSSPSLIVECGGQTVQTAIIKNIKKNPNFPGSVLFLKVVQHLLNPKK
ncbi:hypothetical protein cypCar_00038301 [Cyprinus carpio]|nr:hypothetical protein cypCar_00038301 [Cyprinus carpio]